MFRAMILRATIASVVLTALPVATTAAPARIVILTNSEAADAWRLCEIGQQRAEALRYNYLGDKAAKSLFKEGEPPAFFFAITPLTVATATPASLSWRKPIIHYSVMPQDDAKKTEEALRIMRRAHAGFRRTLGEGHPHTRIAGESAALIEAQLKP